MNILVLTYWSFSEPLIQTYTLPHVRQIKQELGKEGKVYLLTLEKSHLKLSKELKKNVKAQLKQEGIVWIPSKYYAFGLQTLFAFIPLLFRLISLILFKKIKIIHAWCTPAGAIGWFLSVITRRKLVIDSYEPHAESMLENGTWTKRSLPFRLLFKLEKLQTRRATACIGLTAKMPEYSLEKYGYKPKIYFTKPATVNTETFHPEQIKDFSLIGEDSLCNKIICIYAGKTGGIYLDQEIFDFFKCCADYWKGGFKAILLTDTSADYIEKCTGIAGIAKGYIWFQNIQHQDVPKYMNLAHFALNPVKPVPSKRYCTSIKDSEYWAMGLPVVITPNISDDSEIIEQAQIGAVLQELNPNGYLHAVKRIDELLKADSTGTLRSTIIDIAIQFRSPEIAIDIYNKLYNNETGILTIKPSFIPRNQVIVYCFHSLKDPLVEGLILSYLRGMDLNKNTTEVYLITLEQKPHKLSSTQKLEITHTLKESGIHWKPFNYHSGQFLLLKKTWDFIRVATFIIYLRLIKKTKRIIGFLPIAGAYSAILGKLLFMKSYVYCFEPHSMYLIDFGSWKKSSLKTRLLLYFEKFQVRNASTIVVPTRYTQTLIAHWRPIGKINVLPISVDTDLFKPYQKDPLTQSIRQDLGYTNEHKVIIYTGKLGGLYYSPPELAQFIEALTVYDSSYRFLIITNNPVQEVNDAFILFKIPKERYRILPPVAYQELPYYISAADAGMLAIPPHPSQKYRTPVKTGLYLACGIPYITCEGIAEDDTIATTHKIGISIPDMKKNYAKYTHESIQNLFNDDNLLHRCREYAVNHRSATLTKEILQEMILR